MTGSRRVVLDVPAKATDHPRDIEVHRRTTLIDQAGDLRLLIAPATDDGAMTCLATAPSLHRRLREDRGPKRDRALTCWPLSQFHFLELPWSRTRKILSGACIDFRTAPTTNG